jgi:hypothetical protein
VVLGFQFDHTTIVPGEGSRGHVLFGIYDMFLNIGRRAYARDLRDYLVTNRAGPLAAERYTGQWNEVGAGSDDGEFWYTLWQMYGERRERHARDLTRQARQLVATHWSSIERVAQALLQEQTLSFATVEQLVQHG